MDIFNKNKIAELEHQLLLKVKECDSLKSDLRFLERENDNLKTKLGVNSKVVAIVKSNAPCIKNNISSSAQTQKSDKAAKNRSESILGDSMGGIVGSAIKNDVDSDNAE